MTTRKMEISNRFVFFSPFHHGLFNVYSCSERVTTILLTFVDLKPKEMSPPKRKNTLNQNLRQKYGPVSKKQKKIVKINAKNVVEFFPLQVVVMPTLCVILKQKNMKML